MKFYQKGFTLVEMVVVVIVLGILGAIAANQFSGISPNADALRIYDSVNRIRTNSDLLVLATNVQGSTYTSIWNTLDINNGTGADGTSGGCFGGCTMLRVLRTGRAQLKSQYQSAFDQSGIEPMTATLQYQATPRQFALSFGTTKYPVFWVDAGGPLIQAAVTIKDPAVAKAILKYSQKLVDPSDPANPVNSIEADCDSTPGQCGISFFFLRTT